MQPQLLLQNHLHLQLLVGGREVGDGDRAGNVAELLEQLGAKAHAVLALTRETQVDHVHLKVGELVLQGGDRLGEGFVLCEARHGGELHPHGLDALDGLAGRDDVVADLAQEGHLGRDVSLGARRVGILDDGEGLLMGLAGRVEADGVAPGRKQDRDLAGAGGGAAVVADLDVVREHRAGQ